MARGDPAGERGAQREREESDDVKRPGKSRNARDGEGEEDDIPGHVGDRRFAEPEDAHRIDQPRRNRQQQQQDHQGVAPPLVALLDISNRSDAALILRPGLARSPGGKRLSPPSPRR
jgi:hypothetical protein